MREKQFAARDQFNRTEHKNSQALTKIGSKTSFLVRQSIKNEGIILKTQVYKQGSGYIYVTVTCLKSRISSFFNIFRVANKFINFIINP